MTSSLISAASTESLMMARSSSPTRLRGPRLWLARIGWIIVVILVLAVSWELLRRNYWQTWGEWRIGEAREAATSFTSYSDFVRIVITMETVGAVVSIVVGLLVAWKRSYDWMGLFVSATLILLAPILLSANMDVWRFPLNLRGLSPLLPPLRILSMSAILLLLYWFPDGRFVPRWALWPALAGVISITIFWLLSIGVDTGIIPHNQTLGDLTWLISMLVFLLAMLFAVGAQIFRFRRVAAPVQRQQVKWVVYGLAAIPTIFVVDILMSTLLNSSQAALIGVFLFQLFLMILPLTIGISILRFRLWDIDILINRTLVYGVLTLLILVFYGLLLGVLALLFQAQIGPALAVVATAFVALLALPLRQRVQQGINRLMYGERDDPVEVLSLLGKSLETTGAPDEVLPKLAQTIAGSLRLPYVAVLLRQETDFEVVAEYGNSTDDGTMFPLTYQGEIVGRLLVAPRAYGEYFSPMDERLLRNIARQAGTAVHAVQLTVDLQRSRERLVVAREEERRRLRRDLHDGLGPQLATLTLKVDAARNLLADDPDGADALLVEMKSDARASIADIRRLVYELRPPALDQLGLVAALHAHAAQNSANGMVITIHAADDMPDLPAAVEVAAYRIATEALTNCIRHAQAAHVIVRLSGQENLVMEISDDGQGLPDDFQPGVGMSSMRERAQELGGSFAVESNAEGGVRVVTVLPLSLTL